MSTAVTRIKAPATARSRVASPAEAADALARIAEIRADMAEAERAFAAHVEELRRVLDTQAATLTQEEAALVAAIQDWAEANRRKLTNDGKRKSFAVGAGRAGWAKGKDRIEIEDGAEEAIMARMRALDLERFLRVKESIDKQALIKEPKLAATFAGVAIVEGAEAFFVEPGAAK